MALQVIEPSGPSPVILSSGGPGSVLRVVLPEAFSRGVPQPTPGFFSEAVQTPAQGLASPSVDQVPDDSISSCYDSNGVLYCRTALTYCEDGVEQTIYVLASAV